MQHKLRMAVSSVVGCMTLKLFFVSFLITSQKQAHLFNVGVKKQYRT